MSEPTCLILASQSPRRKELLTKAGFHFDVCPAHIEESVEPAWMPEECACKLAQRKAQRVVRDLRKTGSSEYSGKIVLAADTIVALEDEIFGKPESDEHAYKMLWALSRNVHRVITGVCLWPIEKTEPFISREITHVKMRSISNAEIREYIASGEGRDKAGGYAIQETADRFIESIDGEYDNVVGLPLQLVKTLLDKWNVRKEGP